MSCNCHRPDRNCSKCREEKVKMPDFSDLHKFVKELEEWRKRSEESTIYIG